jgi:hypothetical protein
MNEKPCYNDGGVEFALRMASQLSFPFPESEADWRDMRTNVEMPALQSPLLRDFASVNMQCERYRNPFFSVTFPSLC